MRWPQQERHPSALARDAARAAGEALFSTSKACRNGHFAQRYTSTGTCVACSAARVKRYNKSLGALSKERIRARVNARLRARSAATKPQRDARRAEKREAARLREREYNRRYQKANRARYNSLEKARYARKMRAMPAWVSRGEIDAIYAEASRRRKKTGLSYEVDHIVPLQGESVCGLHVAWNLRIVTKTENVAKGNKLLEELL